MKNKVLLSCLAVVTGLIIGKMGDANAIKSEAQKIDYDYKISINDDQNKYKDNQALYRDSIETPLYEEDLVKTRTEEIREITSNIHKGYLADSKASQEEEIYKDIQNRYIKHEFDQNREIKKAIMKMEMSNKFNGISVSSINSGDDYKIELLKPIIPETLIEPLVLNLNKGNQSLVTVNSALTKPIMYGRQQSVSEVSSVKDHHAEHYRMEILDVVYGVGKDLKMVVVKINAVISYEDDLNEKRLSTNFSHTLDILIPEKSNDGLKSVSKTHIGDGFYIELKRG